VLFQSKIQAVTLPVAPVPPVFSPWRVHALGFIAMGSIMSIMLISPVIPLYLDQRGLPPVHVGGVIGAMSLALMAAEVLALGVTSWVGRRLAVIVALAGSAMMFAWFPLTVSLAGLYATRLVLGAARGMLWPVAFAEVAEAGPLDQRAGQFSLFWLYFGIGQLLGPLIGGLLGEKLSLTAPFFAAALGSLLLLPAAGIIRSVRDDSPNPLRSYATLLARAPGVGRIWLVTMLNTVAFSIMTTFLPLHAAANGLSTAEIGLIFTGGGVAFIVAQATLNRIAHRIPAERFLVPAYVIRGLGVALVPLLTSFQALFVVNFLTSLGAAPIPNGLSMRVTARSPREHLVAAMGGFNAAADLGFFLGPVVGGILAGWGLKWAFAIGPLVTLPAVIWLAGDR